MPSVAINGLGRIGRAALKILLDSDGLDVAAVNDTFRQEAATERYQEVLGVADDPLVSAAIVGDPRAAVVDLELTTVVDGTLVKVKAWYDNEWLHPPDDPAGPQHPRRDVDERMIASSSRARTPRRVAASRDQRMNGGGRKSMKECAEGVLMEAIRMVLVTLVLVTGGVLALALVAHLTARVQRRSTGPRFLGSLGDRPGDRSAGDGAGDGGSVGPPTALDTRGGFACPASSDDLEGVARMERWDGNVS